MEDAITLIVTLFLLCAVSLSQAVAWWESGSTYDPKRGRFVATEQYKKDRGIHWSERVCQSGSCWSSKSGRPVDAETYNEQLGRQRSHVRGEESDHE